MERIAGLYPILCIIRKIPYDNIAPIDMAFVIFNSKFNALENIILILDQIITGKQNRIEEVIFATSLNSLPNTLIKIPSATSLNK